MKLRAQFETNFESNRCAHFSLGKGGGRLVYIFVEREVVYLRHNFYGPAVAGV